VQAAATSFPLSKHTGGGDTVPSMFIYSAHGRWVFPPLLWSFPSTAAFTSFPAPDCWAVLLLLLASMFVYSSCGRFVFPPLLGSVPPSTTLTSFPAPGCWMCPRSHLSLSSQAWPVYLQFQEGFPSLPLQSLGCPTLFAMSLYCSYCLLLSFSFFPGWRSVCPGGYADLAQGFLWKYHILLSSPCPCLPKTSGHG
jgi:hypothetical protein